MSVWDNCTTLLYHRARRYTFAPCRKTGSIGYRARQEIARVVVGVAIAARCRACAIGAAFDGAEQALEAIVAVSNAARGAAELGDEEVVEAIHHWQVGLATVQEAYTGLCIFAPSRRRGDLAWLGNRLHHTRRVYLNFDHTDLKTRKRDVCHVRHSHGILAMRKCYENAIPKERNRYAH